MDIDEAMAALQDGKPICDIGQIDAVARRKLDRLAARGVLRKWRDHWYPGLGPLKTWFALAALATLAGCGAQPGNPFQGPPIGQMSNTDAAATSQVVGDLLRKK